LNFLSVAAVAYHLRYNHIASVQSMSFKSLKYKKVTLLCSLQRDDAPTA